MATLTSNAVRWVLFAILVAAASTARAADDRFFVSNGVEIRYIDQGRGDPVILVHGYAADIESQWADVIPELARTYRVVAMDARGHGKSGKPHVVSDYGPEMGLDVVRLMDHLSIQKAHVVGYAMGANIVAHLVTVYPDSFLTLTLGGASGWRNWTPEQDRRAQQEASEMEQGLLSTQILRHWPMDQPKPDAARLREISAERLAGKDPKALAAVRRSGRNQVVTDAQMAEVRVPTLGIVGTNDPCLNDFISLERVVPHLRLVRIEGASHGAAPHTPEFVRALKAFLAEHPRSP